MSRALEDLSGDVKRFAISLLMNHVLTEFEPETVELLATSPATVGAVTRAIHSAGHDELVYFATAKAKDDFLAAALRYLAELEDHEELLVAFGRRTIRAPGGGPGYAKMWRCKGSRSHVSLSPALWHAIMTHAKLSSDAEILLIHNHPPNATKSILSDLFGGWKPLASSQDRELALRLNIHSIGKRLLTGRGPRFECYVVDEGSLTQFFLPSWERIAQILEQLIK